MPKIFDESDPKAVPDAPTGRNVPDIPIAEALAMEGESTTGENESLPVTTLTGMHHEPAEVIEDVPAEEKPIEVTDVEDGMETAVEDIEDAPTPAAQPEQAVTDVEDGMETAAEDIEEQSAQPDPELLEPAGPPAPEKTGGSEHVIEPGGGFSKGDGPDAAAKAVGRLLTALITEGGDVAGFKERVDRQITPLMDVTTRAERQAIRDHLATMQADAIHAANFTDVVSIQHALDLIAERWTQQAPKRKSKEERAFEKRVKDTREGAAVLIAAFELLKSIVPEGVEVTSSAREESEALIVEVGQYIRWIEGGKKPETEPEQTRLGKRVIAAFRAGVKGVSLEEYLRPSAHEVVTVNKGQGKVGTPDEPVREPNVKLHLEELFAKLPVGRWVSIQQVVDQPSSEYPDKETRPDATVVKSLVYGEEIDGVEGYTHNDVEGGWKPSGTD